jgi:hypothetical protein
MLLTNNSHPVQISFPTPEVMRDPHPKCLLVEEEIFSQYKRSIEQRLKLVVNLREQGKLTFQQASAETQLLHSQLLQTQKDLGIGAYSRSA